MADLVLAGATVVTMDAERRVLQPGHVVVADGAIAAVGAGPPTTPTARVLDLTGRIVLPGFVNAHDHLVSSLTRGLGGDRFQTGGGEVGKAAAAAIREELDEEACHAAARLALTESMLSGVTTVADSQTARRGLESGFDGTLRALTESGMRGALFRASVDRTELIPAHRHDDLGLAVEELDRLRAVWQTAKVRVGAEALALHRVGRELLDGLHGWAESRDAPFAMHLSYSEAAARHAVDEHGRALLRVLADSGVLDHRFLGHHPVWIDDTEIAALTAVGAGVSVCAPANMLIGTKAAPLPSLIAAGARIGLGTDQPNDGHDFFAVMKGTVLQQRAQHQSTEFGSPELMLELATIGGARAMHLEAEIGSIEAGKRADLVVVDARRPTLNPAMSAVSNLVYAASPGDVESVFVDGVEIVRHGVPLAWEIEDTVDAVNRVVEGALRRHGLAPLLVTSWPVVDGDGTVERERE